MNLINLSQELVEAIFQHLIKKPYEEVAHLIDPLKAQAAPQIQAAQAAQAASTDAPAAVDAPVDAPAVDPATSTVQ